VAEDEWLEPAEAARLLDVPERVVYTLIQEGKLRSVRWPARILRSDLDKCLDACRIKPGDLAHLNQYSGGQYRYKT
jgi:excisionase family DNA binding protein